MFTTEIAAAFDVDLKNGGTQSERRAGFTVTQSTQAQRSRTMGGIASSLGTRNQLELKICS